MSAIDFIWETLTMLKFVFLYGWPVMILIWLFIMRMVWKKWPIDAVIIEKRGDNLIKTNDRAGKYRDSYTGMIGYKLRKAKDTIPVMNYDHVLHNNAVPTTISERIVNLIRGNIGTIFLFRYGSKQYKPVKVQGNPSSKTVFQEVKSEDGDSKYIKIYQLIDPRDKLGALDFEVIDWDNMNFMVQEQRASFARRQKKGELWKQALIPIGMLIVTAMVCIIMIKFGYDYAVGMKASGTTAGGTSAPATKPNIPIISDLLPGE